MAQDIVGSLFGPNPAQIQQDYITQESNRANQYANLNPFQQANYGAMVAGQMGGRAISGLMGAEDPRLTQARQMEQVKQWIAQSGVDMNTPEGLAQAAQYAQSIGATEGAMYFGRMSQEIRKNAAEEQYKLAQAQAALREKKGTPEHQAQQIRLSQLQAQYGDEEGANRFMVEQQQLAERRSPKTTVNVVSQQESEFSKELGKIQGKQMEGAYNTRNAAVKTLDTLSKMATLNDDQLISGSFSGPRKATANFLNTVGLASQADAKRLSNTQQFDKVAGDLVLSNIKQLGYNPSNADVKFLNETLPNLETSPQARKALINWMATKAQGSITEVKNMEQYAIKNKSLNGYTPVVPNFNPTGGTQPSSLQGMSDDDLAAAIAAKKGKK